MTEARSGRRRQFAVGDAGGDFLDQKQQLGGPRHRETLQDRLRRMARAAALAATC